MSDFNDVKVPVGPQHPALKEPESFLITLRGEKVTAASVRMGYNHRGIEKAAESRTYVQNIYLLERVCGICSHSHSTCFINAVEEIAALDVPKRAHYIRTIIGELERVHSHLLWLGVAGHEIGFDTLLMYSWRDREAVMDLLVELTGNRVNYGMNTVGGVRRDISPEQVKEILRVVDLLEERTKYYIELATTDSAIIQRLSNVGRLSKEHAERFGAVGPLARASGVDRDTRRDDPYNAYAELDFNVITTNTCDVYGRTVVRVLELMETYKIIRQAVKNLPEGPISVKMPRKIQAGEAVARYEAPRGEDVHYVRANGTDKPDRVKVRAPTLANMQSVAHMLEDGYLADMPIVIAAIDPCFSCTDRMIRINEDVAPWEKIRLHGIEFYKNRGISLDETNRKLESMLK